MCQAIKAEVLVVVLLGLSGSGQQRCRICLLKNNPEILDFIDVHPSIRLIWTLMQTRPVHSLPFPTEFIKYYRPDFECRKM